MNGCRALTGELSVSSRPESIKLDLAAESNRVGVEPVDSRKVVSLESSDLASLKLVSLLETVTPSEVGLEVQTAHGRTCNPKPGLTEVNILPDFFGAPLVLPENPFLIMFKI